MARVTHVRDIIPGLKPADNPFQGQATMADIVSHRTRLATELLYSFPHIPALIHAEGKC